MHAIITAGVDVGSVSSQAAVMCDGKLYCYASMRTGSDSPDSARKVMDWALQETGLTLDKVRYAVGTGYGRVNVPFANRAINGGTISQAYDYDGFGRVVADDCPAL